MTELAVVTELQVKTTPSALYNNLSCSANVFAFAHQQDCVVVRPLGAHRLPIPDGEKASITFCGTTFARGRPLVVVCTVNGATLWDASRDVVLARFPTAETRAAAFVEFGDRLMMAFGLGDGTVTIYELSAEFAVVPIGTHRPHNAPVTCIAASNESTVLFATGDNSGHVHLWNATLQPYVGIPATLPTECCTSIAIAGPSLVAATYGSGKLRLFAPTGEMRIEINAHCRWINAMAFHRSGMLLATVGDDSCIAVWQLPSAENPRVSLIGFRKGKNVLYTGVAFNLEGTNVVAAAFDNDKVVTYAVPQR